MLKIRDYSSLQTCRANPKSFCFFVIDRKPEIVANESNRLKDWRTELSEPSRIKVVSSVY